MKKYTMAAMAALLAMSTIAMAEELPRKWGYYGEEGPMFWGDLDESFEGCNEGYHQSPIALKDPILAKLKDFSTSYLMSPAFADDAGYTLRVDMKNTSNHLQLGDQVFDLNEFHFHQPAEHPIDGKLYPLELHFVNISESGDAVALGVFFEVGAENAALKALLPAFKASKEQGKNIEIQINPNDLQPPKGSFYRYEGSLTTPPCREGLVWLIYQKPMTLSAEQLAMFNDLMIQNARPVQKMHSRMLMQSQ
ncbi:MAG: carbonic anhydrase [Gammaproteobacteria bacterium]